VVTAWLLGCATLLAQGNDLAAAQKLNLQVESLEASERYGDAIPLAEQSLTIHERVLGVEHTQTDAARGRLAVLYVSAGAFDQAEALLRRSFAIHQRSRKPVETRELLSGRAFLLRDAGEPGGYGLHSFLLFYALPRDAIERTRYLKALEAYLLILQPLAELERHRLPRQLNVTLSPVKQAIELSDDFFDAGQVARSAERILMEYDFARAQVLLDDFGKEVIAGGPYLISRIPGAPDAATPRLFLDMSHVAPGLVGDWIRTFCWLAAQERSWSEVALQKLALNIRNVIAVAAVVVDTLPR
jgi:hypothetical protein